MSEESGPQYVMVVEDDAGIGAMLKHTLSTQLGAEVLLCVNLADAQSRVALPVPELILLDLGLPDGDGIAFCRGLRLWSNVPVIVISAQGDDLRKVEALDAGADDYLVKPFSVSELMARIRSVWRRLAPTPIGTPPVSEIGGLTVDNGRHIASVDDRRLDLTPKEFALLSVLAHNGDRIAPHRDLLREVWGDGCLEEVHYVRNVVKALRSKMSDAGARAQIVNERGIGYRLHDGRDC